MNNFAFSLENIVSWDNQKLARKFDTSMTNGLSLGECSKRLKQVGLNQIETLDKPNIVKIFISQFKSPIVWLLLIAMAISFAFSDFAEMYAILMVVLINAVIGGVTEFRAIESMDALRSISQVSAMVIRSGKNQEIMSSLLVPGDIVCFNSGDMVSADMCLLTSTNFQVDESTLTGESLPVSKQAKQFPNEENTQEVIAKKIIYKGTSVVRGKGTALVIATGKNTELGKISHLLSHAEASRSPLEQRIQKLSGQLIKLTIGLIILITAIGIFNSQEPILMIKTGIALAVAAIPEGLLIVTTLALARAMLKLSKQKVLIEHLSAVETLGATTLIMTDKTGTITENKMSVTEVLLDVDTNINLVEDNQKNILANNEFSRVALVACLCNNAILESKKSIGDPIEIALLEMCDSYANAFYLQRNKYQEVLEEPFDPDIRMMATVHTSDDSSLELPYFYSVKGAPESLFETCAFYLSGHSLKTFDSEVKHKWLNEVEKMAQKGLRVLALAYKQQDNKLQKPFNQLILAGVVGMEDPLRKDVPQAIQDCKNAGIKVVMVTGDNGLTAFNIAKKIALSGAAQTPIMTGKELETLTNDAAVELNDVKNVSVFSRVNPQQKYLLANTYQANGQVVAMTGDGVNDAPALKKADIGIAMGIRGTQVARQASDMVLLNDAFASIVKAIAEGRTIFSNIRKFVLYLLSCNLSEILIVTIAVLSGFPIPLLPLQILFLNLVTDVFPALALGTCKSSQDLLNRPPRNPKESIVEKHHWMVISIYAVFITAITLAAYLIALYPLQLENEQAITVAFLTLALAQIFHVFNMRGENQSFISNEVISNPNIWYALGTCLVLILAAVYIPAINAVLRITSVSNELWILIIGFSSLTLILKPLVKWISGIFIKSNSYH